MGFCSHSTTVRIEEYITDSTDHTLQNHLFHIIQGQQKSFLQGLIVSVTTAFGFSSLHNESKNRLFLNYIIALCLRMINTVFRQQLLSSSLQNQVRPAEVARL